MIKKVLLIILAFYALYNTSCTNKKEVEAYPNFICDTTNARFSVEVKDVFTRNCYNCHSAANANSLGGGTNLENYGTVRAFARSGILLGNITFAPGANPMPKGGSKISNCDIDKIRAWINRGSLNN